MHCALPCHLFPIFMLPCASVVYMICNMHLTRCVFWHVACLFFLCFFSIYCFVAAIYANKDVYKDIQSASQLAPTAPSVSLRVRARKIIACRISWRPTSIAWYIVFCSTDAEPTYKRQTQQQLKKIFSTENVVCVTRAKLESLTFGIVKLCPQHANWTDPNRRALTQLADPVYWPARSALRTDWLQTQTTRSHSSRNCSLCDVNGD